MNQPHRCHSAAIAPNSRTRAGWNQALLAAAAEAGNQLVLDLDEAGRFDAGLIACLGLVEQELLRRGGWLRLKVSDPAVRALIVLAGLQRLMPAEGGPPLELSCTAAFGDDELRLTLQHGLGLNPRLATTSGHNWMSRLAVRRATVDMAELTHVNSIIVAWLLQLAQAAKPAELVLVNVNRQVAIQFNQLRLNHVLQVQPSADG